MKKHWKQLVALLATLILGFIIGFYYGEKIYIWLIRPFHNTNGQFDLSIWWTAFAGVGTLILAVVAVWQNLSLHKRNEEVEKLRNRPFFAIKSMDNQDNFIIKTTDDIRDGQNIKMCNGISFDFQQDTWIGNVGEYIGLISQQITGSLIIKNVGVGFAHSVRFIVEIDGTEHLLHRLCTFAPGDELLYYPLYDMSNYKYINKNIKFIIMFSDVCNTKYVQCFDVVYKNNLQGYLINSEPKEE